MEYKIFDKNEVENEIKILGFEDHKNWFEIYTFMLGYSKVVDEVIKGFDEYKESLKKKLIEMNNTKVETLKKHMSMDVKKSTKKYLQGIDYLLFDYQDISRDSEVIPYLVKMYVYSDRKALRSFILRSLKEVVSDVKLELLEVDYE